MLAASAGLIAVLNGLDQSGLRVRLQMTLPGGVYPDLSLTIESLSIDASITTDMPNGTRLAAGYPAMQASFTLSGLVDQRDESLTAAWLFGLYPAKATIVSPLYRKTVLGSAVTIDVGAPPAGSSSVDWLRKFTGSVDSLTVNPAAGTVEFSCIDSRNLLRSVPALPAVITTPPFNAGLTSEYVIDALLRAATQTRISSWPARRPQCIFAAGMRSSVWPELGTLNNYSPIFVTGASNFVPGVFGTAYQETTANSSFVGWTMSAALGTSVFFEFWVTRASSQSVRVQVGAPGFFIELEVFSDHININVGAGPGINTVTWTTAVGTGARYVAVQATLPTPGGGTACSGTVYLDGTSFAFNNPAPNGRSAALWDQVSIKGNISDPVGGATIEALQVTTETAPTINYPFTPKAILDQSLNTLQVIPAIDAGTDPWQVIQGVADAELGVAGFDEAAIFHFYNRVTIRTGAVQRTISATQNLKTLSMTSDASSFANHVTVPYTSWATGDRGLVFTNTAVWSVGPMSTEVFPITFDGTVGSVDSTASVLPNFHTYTDGSSYYRASTSASGGAEHPGITVAISISSTGPIVTITNPSTKKAFLCNPANYTDTVGAPGVPTLWLGGISATPANEITVDYQYPDIANGGAASGPRGDVAVALASDSWIQDRDSATVLALDLLIDLYLPRPDFASLDIVPDPRLQLLDSVLVQDVAQSGVNEYARIWGWTLSFAADGWAMTVDARTITSPGQWILGVAGRSELGVTTYI